MELEDAAGVEEVVGELLVDVLVAGVDAAGFLEAETETERE